MAVILDNPQRHQHHLLVPDVKHSKLYTNSLNVNEEFLTCAICTDDFNDPRSLPCLHSFCKNCITDHIVKSTMGLRAPKGFNCPTCLRFVDAPDPHTPPNTWSDMLSQSHLINSLMGGVKLRNDVSRCDPCYRRKEKVIAAKWCKECSEALCEQCVSFHKSLKYSQHHTLLDFEDLREQPIKNTLARPPCPHHENTTLGFFCEDHQKVVCSSCVTVDHRKCSHVMSSTEAASKQRTDAEGLTEKLRQQNGWSARIMENRQHSVKTLEDAEAQLTHQITSIRAQMNELLLTQEKRIIEELKQLKRKEKEEYEHEIAKCEEMICTTNNAMNILKNSLAHGTDSDVLLSMKSVKGESKKCERDLTEMSRNLRDILLIFTPERTISTVLGTLKEIGKITFSHSHVQVAPPYNVHVDMSRETSSVSTDRLTPESPTKKTETYFIKPVHDSRKSDDIASTRTMPEFDTRRSLEILDTRRALSISKLDEIKASSYRYDDSRRSNSKLDETPRSKLSYILHKEVEDETPRFSPLDERADSPETYSDRKISSYQAKLEFFFKARSYQDRENCILTGAVYLSDGRVVLVDQMMRKLKLFDQNYKWIGEKVLPGRPYDITAISEREVAVTFPRDRKIQVFAVRLNDFLPIFTINTTAKCWGIAYSPGFKRFAVCCYAQPPCVKIISRTDGRELRTLARDRAGIELFYFPDYIAIDNSGRNLYITDKYRKTVISITSDGAKRWETNYPGLKNPRGIAVHGNKVYVAGSRSHNIVQLSTEGDIIGDIVMEGVSFPNKVALSPGAERLLITQYQGTLIDIERNTVKVYRLD